jgi:hypothetical protein
LRIFGLKIYHLATLLVSAGQRYLDLDSGFKTGFNRVPRFPAKMQLGEEQKHLQVWEPKFQLSVTSTRPKHFKPDVSSPGTDVMIFKIFSPKNLAKILAFFAQTTASFCKNCDHNIGF